LCTYFIIINCLFSIYWYCLNFEFFIVLFHIHIFSRKCRYWLFLFQPIGVSVTQGPRPFGSLCIKHFDWFQTTLTPVHHIISVLLGRDYWLFSINIINTMPMQNINIKLTIFFLLDSERIHHILILQWCVNFFLSVIAVWGSKTASIFFNSI